MKRTQPLFFLFCLSIGLISAQEAMALIHQEPPELYAKSDIVVIGDVVSVIREGSNTFAQIRVKEPYKGSVRNGAIITVKSSGRNMLVQPDEPEFIRLQQNLLFLVRWRGGKYRSRLRDDDRIVPATWHYEAKPGVLLYECVNKADGQKVIHGNNVYPYHDNAAYSVPLKDYLESLDVAVKTLAKPPQQA